MLSYLYLQIFLYCGNLEVFFKSGFGFKPFKGNVPITDKKLFLKISQISLENTFVGVLF